MMPKMVKNPLRLTLKLFIILWALLLLQVVLKLTFNYWQPYVIPTPQLEALSNFIDEHEWLKVMLNGIFYLINGLMVILCCIKQWWFKNKKQLIITTFTIVTGYIYNLITGDSVINTIVITVILPLCLDIKKWVYVILTFVCSNLFLAFSLWLEGFVNADSMNYITRMFLQFDYYIMLVLCYLIINLIKAKEVR